MNATTPTPATTQPRPAAKHTPGPWEMNGSSIETTATKTAVVGWTNTDDDTNGGNAEANARLIAASPELLRELKKCVAAIQKWGKAHPESGGWTGLIHGGLKAIAKAEGGAQ